MSAVHRINCDPETSFLLVIEWRDGDVARNLSGYSFDWRVYGGGGAVVLSQPVIINAGAGQITLHALPGQLAADHGATGGWRLLATDPAGDTWRLIGGPVDFGPAFQATANGQLIIVDTQTVRLASTGVPVLVGAADSFDTDLLLQYQVAKL